MKSESNNVAIAKKWVGYWDRANAVSFENVWSVENMNECRKWCPFMCRGVVSDISDAEMYEGLRMHREDLKDYWHGKQCEDAAMAVLKERALNRHIRMFQPTGNAA